MNPLIISAICIFGMMSLLYLTSRFTKDNSIVDIFWGFGFVLVAVVLFTVSPYSLINLILLIMIVLWGARLSLHLANRNLGKPEDFRYAEWRREWGSTEIWRAFLQVYLLQGSIMFVMTISIVLVLANNANQDLSWIHIVGIVIFGVGFLVETIADYQKSAFKKHSPSKLMKDGLWSISRHPNYFGEVMLWWGIGIYCMASGYFISGLISALVINLLIRFVSGVPMLEKSKVGNKEYEQYAKDTPVFIPYMKA